MPRQIPVADGVQDTHARNIVIVGGGFAGTTLAQALEHRLPPTHRVVLVSEESYTTFNPMLAEVVGAAVFPEHVVAPIRQMLSAPASQFVMGRVQRVDFHSRLLHASTLAGLQALPFEHIVFAFGSRANLDLVPGLQQHALPLKLVGDALHIRNRVLQRLARIELEHDPIERRRLGHFVVIGGGFSGVETAGSLADYLRSARRFYPRVAGHELQVTVLQDADRLLLELPEPLGQAAARSLMSRGVAVRRQARAAHVAEHGVTLADGDFIAAGTVVCTIGTRPNPLLDALGLPSQRGRIETRADLSVPGPAGAWAIGDCALVRNGEALAPPTAQFAVAEAQALAANLLATVEGRPTRAFSHQSRGMMATTGHLKGVAQVGRLRLSGLAAWLLWRAYYLMRMPTAGRKLRIWVEWTWSMFFAADITHLRFTRTPEADAPADAATERPARPAAAGLHHR